MICVGQTYKKKPGEHYITREVMAPEEIRIEYDFGFSSGIHGSDRWQVEKLEQNSFGYRRSRFDILLSAREIEEFHVLVKDIPIEYIEYTEVNRLSMVIE